MTNLNLVGGVLGRLIRAPGLVAFIRGDEPALLGVLSDSSEHLRFKALAAHIVSRDFDVPAFVAVDLECDSFFLFGDIVLRLDQVEISGADSATWVEQSAQNAAVISCSCEAGHVLEGTRLDAGCVPAGGFSLQRATGLTEKALAPAVPRREPTSDAKLDKTSLRIPDPNETATDLDVLADPGIDLETIGAPADLDHEPEPEAPVDAEREPEPEAPTPSPEATGGPTRVGPTRADPVPSRNLDQDETEDDQGPGHALKLGDPSERHGRTADIEAERPRTLQRSDLRTGPPAPSLRNAERDRRPNERSARLRSPDEPVARNSDPTETYEEQADVGRATARIAFRGDDQVDFDGGLIAGRYPEKEGVPEGYQTMTIGSSDVSRVHLELWIADRKLYACDRKTPNGSTLHSRDGSRPLTTDGGDEMLPGESIEFGSQLVIFEGWVEHA